MLVLLICTACLAIVAEWAVSSDGYREHKFNFQWTPKDLRMIFRSNFEKRNTCMNRPSERKKKNALKSKPIDRDGLKQLKLFDMKVVGSPGIHVKRVDTVSGPPGATCLGSSSNNGRQKDMEKATILNK